MKKLCYICHGLGPNGIDMFIVNILSALNKSKWDISLIIAVDEGAEQFNEQKVREMRIPIYRTNDMCNTGCIFTHYKKLKKLLQKIRPDIVHSNMGLLDGLNCFVAKLVGVPIRVSHAHGLHTNSVGLKGICAAFSHIYAKIMRWMINLNSNRYCGCSKEAMQYVFGKKLCKTGKAVFIPNGIDLDRFRYVDRVQSIKNFGFDHMLHRIVSVGRLATVKNSLFIVEIISELNKMRNDCELIWVGNGSLELAIKEKSEALGVSELIKMLGARNDVNEILACCDVFILPSIKEGLPLVLVEAQATGDGLPCVVSTGVSEDANCGKVIRLPLKEGPQKFAQTISDILDGKIQMQIDEEKLQKFDISYTVKQLEEVYGGGI